MEKNLESAEALTKLKDIIESINICMYCTMEAKSDMASRPMGTAKVEDDGAIWFFTMDESGAAASGAEGQEVCLNYASPAKNTYLCVMGNAQLVHDKAKMQELWSDMLKTWFPDGLESPNIALLKVSPRTAHYWDSDVSRVRLAYAYIKAKVTGEADNGAAGDHGKLAV